MEPLIIDGERIPDYTIDRSGKVFCTRLGRYLKPHTKHGPRPYYKVSINTRPRFVHKLLMCTFNPAPIPGLVVDHIDGDPQNNSLDNLRWVTQRMNAMNREFIGIQERRHDLWQVGQVRPDFPTSPSFKTREEAKQVAVERRKVKWDRLQNELDARIRNAKSVPSLN